MQGILQPALVGHLREQAFAEDAKKKKKKAGAGQDAAVGEEGDQPAGGHEVHDMAAEGRAQRLIGVQAIEHGPVALAVCVVAPALRTQDGDQSAEQFQGVGLGLEKGGQGLLQRVAGAGRFAQKPAQEATNFCHCFSGFLAMALHSPDMPILPEAAPVLAVLMCEPVVEL